MPRQVPNQFLKDHEAGDLLRERAVCRKFLLRPALRVVPREHQAPEIGLSTHAVRGTERSPALRGKSRVPDPRLSSFTWGRSLG